MGDLVLGAFDAKRVSDVANTMRHDIINMVSEAGSGHPGGSLSATDILATLYFGGIMKIDPEDPKNPQRDRFVLSKGHAAPALYSVLSQVGYIDCDQLTTLRKMGSKLQGHPDMNKVPGVEVSTGSLGQGLSISGGMALGLKLSDQNGAQKIFTLLGDGELQEGQNWEAAMFAAAKGLDNMIAIVDHNGLQIDGCCEDVLSLGDLEAKFAAFGWRVLSVDGHNLEALYEILSAARISDGRPTVIIAATVKGKGVSFMENQAGWHGKAPNAEQTALALSELDAATNGMGM